MSVLADLVPYGPPALAVIALLLALLAYRTVEEIPSLKGLLGPGVQELQRSIQSLSAALARRTTERAQQTSPRTSAEPASPATAGNSPAQPVYANATEAGIAQYRQQLATWCRIAGTLQEKAAKWEGDLAELGAKAGRDASVLTEKRAGTEFLRLSDTILQVLVSKNDRDIDPEGNHPGLRSALDRLADLGEMEFIQPQNGDRVVDGLHRSISSVPSAGRGRRGTISKVITRGLKRKDNGKIIRPADIIEFK